MRRLLAAAVLGGLIALVVLSLPAHQPQPRLIPPHLFDPTGHLVIGCGFDGAVSMPLVCRGGKVTGVYEDDSTPNPDHWLRLALAKYPLVYRSVAMYQHPKDCHWPHVVCLREQYPVGGYGKAPQMPSHTGVILQDFFRGYAGGGAPSRARVARMLKRARALHDFPIFLF